MKTMQRNPEPSRRCRASAALAAAMACFWAAAVCLAQAAPGADVGAQAPVLDTALATARALRSAYDRATSLISVAEAYAGAGLADRAGAVMEEAIADAADVHDDVLRFSDAQDARQVFDHRRILDLRFPILD
jgi:hypothetical protein